MCRELAFFEIHFEVSKMKKELKKEIKKTFKLLGFFAFLSTFLNAVIEIKSDM